MAARNAMGLPSVGRLPRLMATTRVSLPESSARPAAFSTSVRRCERKNRDANKKRGVSALYRSGPKEFLAASSIKLPKPSDHVPHVKMDKSHGLWGFFPEPGKLMWTPEEIEAHGRPWTVEELRRKSWEDLHALWWVCCKERNMLATSRFELQRGEYGFGEEEIERRDRQIVKTMRSIKHALTQRYYTWEDAYEAAKRDPEIDLEAKDGNIYKPAVQKDSDAGWNALEPEEGKASGAGKPEVVG
ncbi:50S ribosomal protein L4 [Ophiocordyceps camponoti-floridani]|uniref:Large ribosomal subunit protein uL29m n=1 Tax=Ophiocordyceps camponoti-floridani TaxID=2030778 RepID=A0A8H4Q6B1_9HYPO|nr:50S ribosomal protein L4 [Ophiocordyceps camponoti-floridani]